MGIGPQFAPLLAHAQSFWIMTSWHDRANYSIAVHSAHFPSLQLWLDLHPHPAWWSLGSQQKGSCQHTCNCTPPEANVQITLTIHMMARFLLNDLSMSSLPMSTCTMRDKVLSSAHGAYAQPQAARSLDFERHAILIIQCLVRDNLYMWNVHANLVMCTSLVILPRSIYFGS